MTMSTGSTDSTGRGPGSDPLRLDPVRRRSFLNWLLGGSFLTWMAVLFYPILRYLKRPSEAAGGSKIVLTEEESKKLAGAGFVIIRLGSERIIVFRNSTGSLHALQAKCTHEGCTVTYRGDEGLVWCACHNGKFAIDGRVISGPPPKPLVAFRVDQDPKAGITVSRT